MSYRNQIFKRSLRYAGFIAGRGLNCGFGTFVIEVFEGGGLERSEDVGGYVRAVTLLVSPLAARASRKDVILYLLASDPESVYMLVAKVPKAEVIAVVLGLP